MPQSQSVQDAVDHFRQQAWCAKLLDAPGTTTLIPSSRVDRSQDTSGRILSQDEIFHTALNYDGAVPHILVVYQDYDAPGVPPPPVPPGDASLGNGKGLRFPITSVSVLWDIRDHVRGFTGYAHGGFLGAIMDEAMGTFTYTNYQVQATKDAEAELAGKEWTRAPGVVDMGSGGRSLTAFMNVKFKRPVSTPSTIVSTTTLNRIDGRKMFFDVEIRDGTGAVCTTCEGMWVSESPMSAPLSAVAASTVSASSKL